MPPEAAAAAPAPVAAPPPAPEPVASAPEAAPEPAIKAANKAIAEKRKKGATHEKPAAQAEAETTPEAERPDLQALDTDKLFSPEMLSTPEGLERARNVALYAKKELEKRAGRLDGFQLKLQNQEKALETERADIKKKDTYIRGLFQNFHAKMQTVAGLRAAGNAAQIFAVLDELAGGKGDAAAGMELYEAASVAIARDGKIPEKSRGERELETRIQRMEEERKREREDLTREREDAEKNAGLERIAQAESFIGKRAADPARFPMVSGWISAGRTTPEAVGKYVADLIEQAVDAGEPLDMDTAIGILEANLTPPGAQNGSGQPSSAENGSGQPTTPEAKRPARAASTVLPSDADRSSGRGTSRHETDEQRRARLARDPDFLKRSGFGKLARLPGY